MFNNGQPDTSQQGSRLLLWGLVSIVAALLVSFVAVLSSECAEAWIARLLGLNEKNRILTFLGLAMGGVLLAAQAVIANRRAKAMEDSASAQASAAVAQANAATEQSKSNQHAGSGLRQQRLRNAIEHIGHDSSSVRLGGAYDYSIWPRTMRLYSELSEAIFGGGISRKDVDVLVQRLSPTIINTIQEKLKPHIDKPADHDLPKTSKSQTGAYTKQEAENWIAEYEELASNAPVVD